MEMKCLLHDLVSLFRRPINVSIIPLAPKDQVGTHFFMNDGRPGLQGFLCVEDVVNGFIFGIDEL